MDIIYAILGGAATAALISGAFSVVIWLLNRKAQKEDNAAANQTADCAARGREIKAISNKVDAMYLADRLILSDRIKHLGKTYIARHEITAEELEDIMAMHECYHTDLGGNGFLDNIMRQVQELPIKAK